MQIRGCILAIAVAFALATGFMPINPQQAWASGFDILAQNTWVDFNTDEPGWFDYLSDASHDGRQWDNLDGSIYWRRAESSASGVIIPHTSTAGRGAGGHHTEFWEATLQLVGQAGDQADLYFDSQVYGEWEFQVSPYLRAWAAESTRLIITNGDGIVLRNYEYEWGKMIDYPTSGWDEYGEVIDPLFLGTAIIGEQSSIISIYMEHYVTAYAQYPAAGLAAGGGAQATTGASFEFEINAIESAPASVIPIPGAVWLLGSGLIGLAGIRRKFK